MKEMNWAGTGRMDSGAIRCPECGEELSPADLESFPNCPYCNHRFEYDSDLEDFILSPAVRRWIIRSGQRFPGA